MNRPNKTNREQRRHPIHPALPLPFLSDEVVSVENVRGTPSVKGYKTKGKKGAKRHK